MTINYEIIDPVRVQKTFYPQIENSWLEVYFYPSPPSDKWLEIRNKFAKKGISAKINLDKSIFCSATIKNENIKEIFKDNESLQKFLK